MTLLTGNLPLPESQLRDFNKALPRSISGWQEQNLIKDFALILDNLIETAYDPSIGTGHRGVAINALCLLISRSGSLVIHKPLSQISWFKALYIVLDRPDSAKSKPLRQLLICLISALPSFDDGERQQIIERVVQIILQILLQQSDHVKAKPALHILAHMLAKDVISVRYLTQQSESFTKFSSPVSRETKSEDERLQWLLRILFVWIRFQHTSIAAGQTACTLVKKAWNDLRCQGDLGQPIWVAPLIQVLRDNVGELNNYRSHLLPELFKLDVAHYMCFLSALGLESLFIPQGATKQTEVADELDTRLLFVSLEIGKENGIVIDSGLPAGTGMEARDGVIHIPDVMIAQVIENATDAVRLSGVALLISSVTITRPFTPRALRSLQQNFSHLFMETDVHVRGEVLVYVQRLVDRIKAAVGLLSRATEKAADKNRQQRADDGSQVGRITSGLLLQQHREFVRSFLRYVKTQLHPAAAYQRHITGLRSLIVLAKSGLDGRIPTRQLSKPAPAAQWPFSEQIFEPTLTRLLQDLLMDPFEDVRTLAASLLTMQANVVEVSSRTMYSKFLKKAEHIMLLSGRADHADGVSRVNAIVFEAAGRLNLASNESQVSRESQMESLIRRLEERVLVAKNNMAQAVGKFPMHGVLSSLRLILDGPNIYANTKGALFPTWLDFHKRLATALEDVWHCVKGVLCNDAPEGFVPEDMEEEISITTKDILSYCWRALKEASSLLRVLVSKAPIGEADHSLLSQAQFETLCRLTFTELVDLRHRGAFSAVAQAFAACCARSRVLHRDDVLQALYVDTMQAVKAKGSATTRRSAGLPLLVVGILSACPESPLFTQAIGNLLDEAGMATEEQIVHGDPLPQVHALNCLRAVFINTILGPYTEPHIATCLNLAGNCLTSNIWAIRNCGLMLFRALIDRLLGSTESQNWSEESSEFAKPRFSYGDFPNLLDMVLDLLTPDSMRLASARSALESVFPVLKLIQRMPPPAERRSEVRSLVLRLCQSPHWHVRDMAARTYASLVPSAERRSMAKEVIPQRESKQNYIHGRLLCISYLVKFELRSPASSSLPTNELTSCLCSASSYLMTGNNCPFTKALFLDILNILTLNRLKNGAQDFSVSWIPFTNDIAQIFEEPPIVRKSLGLQLLLQYLNRVEKNYLMDHDELTSAESDLLEYLQLFEITDAQTCLQALEPVVSIATSIAPSSLYLIADHLSHSATYNNDRDPYVLTSTRLLLVRLYDVLNKDGHVFHEPLGPNDMRGTLQNVQCLSPSLVMSTVLLWGPVMNEACVREPSRDVLLRELDFLAASLRPLIDEDQSFDLRVTVGRCLATLLNLWRLQLNSEDAKQLDGIRLKFTLLVYDLLNDDDDEIRGIATTVTSAILSNGGTSGPVKNIVPLLAGQRLISHLLKQYTHLPELLNQAVLRMTGMDREPSARTSFESAAAENTALFVVEKQNLFRDPVREAILWSQFLKHLPDIKCFPRASAQRFAQWTKEGLALLHKKMCNHVDGVLGWTSKPDMFVFGMRIWCATDVILTWQRRFGKRSTAMGKMMLELLQILAIGRQMGVHDLWLAKIEKVLVRELREHLKGGVISSNMRAMVARLGDAVG